MNLKKYKKSVSIVLALTIMLSTLPAFALSVEEKLEVVSTMGIVNGDENGKLNLTSNVTRAEFTKMVITASVDKDKAAGVSNVSPFKDVPYTHWAAGYIKLAASNGLIVGYLDGSFRPEEKIKLEEAVSVLLKILGYSNTDFEGSFPEGQLATYKSVGLNKQVTAQKGENLTRRDCVNLLYNLLTAKTKNGVIYATTLGYSMDATGEVNLTSVIDKTVEGPYMIANLSVADLLGSNAVKATVTKNGKIVTIESIKKYDVVYYSENLNRIWCYDNKVSGRVEKISPNTATPTSVTLGIKTYAISGSAAVYKLSSLGEVSVNDTVTLILDKDNSIINVFSPDEVNATIYGVVDEVKSTAFTDAVGGTYFVNAATIFTTAGDTVLVKNPLYVSKGDVVKVEYTSTGENISKVSSTLNGKVNANATEVGTQRIAKDVEIIDASSFANVIVRTEMIAGLELTSKNVKYWTVNEKNEISKLILNNATGDAYSYGILTDVSEINASGSVMGTSAMRGTYTFDIMGVGGTTSFSDTLFNVHEGPAKIARTGNTVSNIKNLKGERAEQIVGNIVQTSEREYVISEKVNVYTLENSKYYYTTVEETFDAEKDIINVFYDDTATPRMIRLIIIQKAK